MLNPSRIHLTIDLEEFDLPQEYGLEVDFETQIQVSALGMESLLELSQKNNIQLTVFCTACFAKARPDIIQRIVRQGHELGSHGVNHTGFYPNDYKLSADILQEISGVPIKGFRMPRLASVDYNALAQAGYVYDSSLNPTWIPGRYNKFTMPRTTFREGEITIVPVSVTPYYRIPLFWLSFRHLPESIYNTYARQTLRHDGYLNLYFHPWEFIDLQEFPLPRYLISGTGDQLLQRMNRFVHSFRDTPFLSIESSIS